MDCPTCNTQMARRSAAPRPGARVITADMCMTCQSMFFDHHELADVSPTLAKVPFDKRHYDEERPASPKLSRCPSCKAEGGEGPIAIEVLDVTLDFCRSCRGIYFDGGEYEALARAVAFADEARPEVDGYRTAPKAARAATMDVFDCTRCRETKPLGESMVVPGGLVCGPCFYSSEEKKLKEDKGSASHRAEIMRDRFASPDLDPDENSGGGIGGALLVGALGVAAALVGPARYCAYCGLRKGDILCTHR